MEARAVTVAVAGLLGLLLVGVPWRPGVAAAPAVRGESCADAELTELRPAGRREPSWLACPAQVERLLLRLGGAGAPAAPGQALVLDEAGGTALAPLSGGLALLLRRPLDVDTASAEDLALLPGIGPALAARIVKEREAHGEFGGRRRLVRVRGLGPARVAALEGWVAGPLVRKVAGGP